VRTDRLGREYPLALRWTVFPLHPETPEEGRDLADLFASREAALPAMLSRLGKVAAAVGLPLAERSRTYNSRRAQELGKWAESQGKGDPFRRAVYHAYFAEGRNIARIDELVRLAEGVGLAGEEAWTVLMEGTWAAAVDADWERSRMAGVTAVPTHLFQGRRLVGFAPYEDFRKLVEGEG
jgi:predicted DsbA family dithiol-disulfide isomerase